MGGGGITTAEHWRVARLRRWFQFSGYIPHIGQAMDEQSLIRVEAWWKSRWSYSQAGPPAYQVRCISAGRPGVKRRSSRRVVDEFLDFQV